MSLTVLLPQWDIVDVQSPRPEVQVVNGIEYLGQTISEQELGPVKHKMDRLMAIPSYPPPKNAKDLKI